MAGIGEDLRAERRRQGRSLADAAAETRVRESYLAALEEDDFGVLGGDVYARGFIRLYGRYLGLDSEALVARYRVEHAAAPTVSALPSSSYDDVLPPRSAGVRVPSQPVVAAIAILAVLVALFVVFRSGGGETPADDPNAPGPEPADVVSTGPLEQASATEPSLADLPANPLVNGPAPAPLDGPVLEELLIEVRVLAPIRMSVLRGQPPLSNAALEVGDVRQLTSDEAVVFEVSNAAAVEVDVNGLPLIGLGGAGQPVQVSCTIGRTGCDVRPS